MKFYLPTVFFLILLGCSSPQVNMKSVSLRIGGMNFYPTGAREFKDGKCNVLDNGIYTACYYNENFKVKKIQGARPFTQKSFKKVRLEIMKAHSMLIKQLRLFAIQNHTPVVPMSAPNTLMLKLNDNNFLIMRYKMTKNSIVFVNYTGEGMPNISSKIDTIIQDLQNINLENLPNDANI